MPEIQPKLRFQREEGPDGVVLLLSGQIDEQSPLVLDPLVAGLGPRVHLDLGGVQRVNSLGVRSWIQFMRKLAGKQVHLRRCAPMMVEQINAVHGFRGDAQVTSVLAPYLCESCQSVRNEEIVIGKDVDGKSVDAPERLCPICRKPMTFDDLFDRYFLFLRHG